MIRRATEMDSKASTGGLIDGLPTVTAVGGGAPKAFVTHWTGGMGTIEGVERTLKERGLGVEYVMDREGNIKLTGGPGAQDIHDESDPRYGTALGQRLGLNSANTVGMEVIGTPESGYTPAQIRAITKFTREHYPNTPFYGHGEIQSTKMPAEGLALAEAVRKDRAIGSHPASLERGKPIGVDVVDHTGSSTSIDVSH